MRITLDDVSLLKSLINGKMFKENFLIKFIEKEIKEIKFAGELIDEYKKDKDKKDEDKKNYFKELIDKLENKIESIKNSIENITNDPDLHCCFILYKQPYETNKLITCKSLLYEIYDFIYEIASLVLASPLYEILNKILWEEIDLIFIHLIKEILKSFMDAIFYFELSLSRSEHVEHSLRVTLLGLVMLEEILKVNEDDIIKFMSKLFRIFSIHDIGYLYELICCEDGCCEEKMCCKEKEKEEERKQKEKDKYYKCYHHSTTWINVLKNILISTLIYSKILKICRDRVCVNIDDLKKIIESIQEIKQKINMKYYNLKNELEKEFYPIYLHDINGIEYYLKNEDFNSSILQKKFDAISALLFVCDNLQEFCRRKTDINKIEEFTNSEIEINYLPNDKKLQIKIKENVFKKFKEDVENKVNRVNLLKNVIIIKADKIVIHIHVEDDLFNSIEIGIL